MNPPNDFPLRGFRRPALAAACAALLLGAAGFAAEPEPPPHPLAGQRFVPDDVDWSAPLYATDFDDPAELRRWRLEGGTRATIENGRLVLESVPDQRNHLVCWLRREMPADFLLEFSLRPQNRREGLNIVFFNARGVGGESIFESALQPRDGLFRLYHSGDLNNYHISYWSGERGSANVRKNKGFHLVATGPDLVGDAPADKFQVIRLYKRGGTIRLMVDDVISVAYDDDGRAHGPVWTHSGWIGLRQMAHTIRCEYEYLKVLPLRPDPKSSAGAPPAPKPPAVERFAENPIIRPEMLPGGAEGEGINICGPSLIRVPDWLPNPLGKYYLYFAHHKGRYIRLAYADRIEGPWRIHVPGTLSLDDVLALEGRGYTENKGSHVASPDVHIDDERREIRMYFHGQILPMDKWGHRSGVALSKDGIAFKPLPEPIGEPYFRVFRHHGWYYALGRTGNLARSRDGLTGWEERKDTVTIGSHRMGRFAAAAHDPQTNAVMRHTALELDGNVLSVFFTRVGDAPESILLAQAELTGDWTTWTLSRPALVLRPERDYEGTAHPVQRSRAGSTLVRPPAPELQDPCIYREDGRTYLLYSVIGERGIAIAELKD